MARSRAPRYRRYPVDRRTNLPGAAADAMVEQVGRNSTKNFFRHLRIAAA
jgi:hypothetical protein